LNKVKTAVVPMSGGTGGMKVGGGEAMTFAFTKSPTPKVTVTMPPFQTPKGAMPPAPGGGEKPGAQGGEKPGAKDEDKPGGMDDAMADAMMTAMCKGMKLQFIVSVDGTITKTNAKYVNNKRDGVWLAYEDLDGLVKDKAAWEQMKAMGKLQDPKEIKAHLKDKDISKYIMIDPNEKVEIEFE